MLFTHKLTSLLFPFILTSVAYLASALTIRFALNIDLAYFGPPLEYWSLYAPAINLNGSLIPDFLIQQVVGYVLYAAIRVKWVFAVIQASQICFVYVGNALKISYFGEPWVAADMFAIGELVGVIHSAWAVSAAAFALALSLFLVVSLRTFSWAALVLFVPVFLLPDAGPSAPTKVVQIMDQAYGFTRWSPISNFKSRGATVYLIGEIVRFHSDKLPAPSRSDVDSAIGYLRDGRPHTPRPVKLRNVHMIAAESFWDPSHLVEYGYSVPPWAEEFKQLWLDTGQSVVLSPVFGGGTANAEYEALCGRPAATPRIMFQTDILNQNVPCLPGLLQGLGYLTVASHPNRAGFWNRNNVYPRIGFGRFRSANHFVMDDMRGPYLSDSSLLRQISDSTRAMDFSAPLFNYVLTIAAHWPYHGGGAPVSDVAVSPEDRLLEDYAGLMRENSEALLQFIRRIREDDPDALIVLFGDHLPLLGPNFYSYRKAGFLPDKLERFSPTDAFRYSGVPLIVIDGKNGPQRLGAIAMHELPGIMFRLLGLDSPFFASHPEGIDVVRPLDGLGTLVLKNHESFLCREQPPRPASDCETISDWLHASRILARDLEYGHQHAIKAMSSSGRP